jgi:hypothetical protein
MALKRKKRKNSSLNRGGEKKEYEGILFDSGLEIYCYKKLKENSIEASYTPITYELLPKITFEGNDKSTKTILPLKYTPDFIGKDFIIECKGYANESFPLRWKLFKHYLYNNNLKYQLYKPKNQKEVNEMIINILKNENSRKNTCISKSS